MRCIALQVSNVCQSITLGLRPPYTQTEGDMIHQRYATEFGIIIFKG